MTTTWYRYALTAGLLLAAWAEDFQHVGTWTLAVIGGLALLTYAVDFIAGAVGAKRFGASPRAVIGAALPGNVTDASSNSIMKRGCTSSCCWTACDARKNNSTSL